MDNHISPTTKYTVGLLGFTICLLGYVVVTIVYMSRTWAELLSQYQPTLLFCIVNQYFVLLTLMGFSLISLAHERRPSINAPDRHGALGSIIFTGIVNTIIGVA